LNIALNKKIEELKIELANWQNEEKAIQEKIDKKKATLEAQGIPFDLGKINQISKDIVDLYSKRNGMRITQFVNTQVASPQKGKKLHKEEKLNILLRCYEILLSIFVVSKHRKIWDARN
jgi:hypothetical protein